MPPHSSAVVFIVFFAKQQRYRSTSKNDGCQPHKHLQLLQEDYTPQPFFVIVILTYKYFQRLQGGDEPIGLGFK